MGGMVWCLQDGVTETASRHRATGPRYQAVLRRYATCFPNLLLYHRNVLLRLPRAKFYLIRLSFPLDFLSRQSSIPSKLSRFPAIRPSDPSKKISLISTPRTTHADGRERPCSQALPCMASRDQGLDYPSLRNQKPHNSTNRDCVVNRPRQCDLGSSRQRCSANQSGRPPRKSEEGSFACLSITGDNSQFYCRFLGDV